MEAINDYFSGFFATPPIIAGLTGKDRSLITKSWTKVMQQPTKNGIKFFMNLFSIQPKHQSAFPFRNVPTENLPNDKKFQAHVNSVMYSISSITSHLEDEELLIAILNRIGNSHASRSVDRQALADVKQALLDTFEFMGPRELEAWCKLLDVMVDVVAKAIEENKAQK